MLDVLDLWLIEPIRFALLFVLQWAYRLTGSHGWSIFLLSIFFNLLLMPAYHWAEKIQQKERAVQRRMAAKIAEFKHAFKGQERYMMIRALYRHHRYHPAYSLRSLAPLGIQVPFFIATFGLLSDYKPFVGAGFLFLPDLSRPDRLLLGANLMPLMMTALNLIAVQLYSQQTSSSERVQGWIVAGIFLVLLYGSPAGLVLYWTINNLISVVKSFVYASDHGFLRARHASSP
jgi:YidC/Oxa1 family membrane protein insertase